MSSALRRLSATVASPSAIDELAALPSDRALAEIGPASQVGSPAQPKAPPSAGQPSPSTALPRTPPGTWGTVVKQWGTAAAHVKPAAEVSEAAASSAPTQQQPLQLQQQQQQPSQQQLSQQQRVAGGSSAASGPSAPAAPSPLLAAAFPPQGAYAVPPLGASRSVPDLSRPRPVQEMLAAAIAEYGSFAGQSAAATAMLTRPLQPYPLREVYVPPRPRDTSFDFKPLPPIRRRPTAPREDGEPAPVRSPPLLRPVTVQRRGSKGGGEGSPPSGWRHQGTGASKARPRELPGYSAKARRLREALLHGVRPPPEDEEEEGSVQADGWGYGSGHPAWRWDAAAGQWWWDAAAAEAASGWGDPWRDGGAHANWQQPPQQPPPPYWGAAEETAWNQGYETPASSPPPPPHSWGSPGFSAPPRPPWHQQQAPAYLPPPHSLSPRTPGGYPAHDHAVSAAPLPSQSRWEPPPAQASPPPPQAWQPDWQEGLEREWPQGPPAARAVQTAPDLRASPPSPPQPLQPAHRYVAPTQGEWRGGAEADRWRPLDKEPLPPAGAWHAPAVAGQGQQHRHPQWHPPAHEWHQHAPEGVDAGAWHPPERGQQQHFEGYDEHYEQQHHDGYGEHAAGWHTREHYQQHEEEAHEPWEAARTRPGRSPPPSHGPVAGGRTAPSADDRHGYDGRGPSRGIHPIAEEGGGVAPEDEDTRSYGGAAAYDRPAAEYAAAGDAPSEGGYEDAAAEGDASWHRHDSWEARGRRGSGSNGGGYAGSQHRSRAAEDERGRHSGVRRDDGRRGGSHGSQYRREAPSHGPYDEYADAPPAAASRQSRRNAGGLNDDDGGDYDDVRRSAAPPPKHYRTGGGPASHARDRGASIDTRDGDAQWPREGRRLSGSDGGASSSVAGGAEQQTGHGRIDDVRERWLEWERQKQRQAPPQQRNDRDSGDWGDGPPDRSHRWHPPPAEDAAAARHSGGIGGAGWPPAAAHGVRRRSWGRGGDDDWQQHGGRAEPHGHWREGAAVR